MASEKQYPNDKFYDLTATIASGQTESGGIDLQGLELAGIFVPSTFDGSSVSLKAATAADGSFVPVQDGQGAAFSLSAAAGSYVPIPSLSVTAGLRFIKLVAGSAQAATDTVFTLAIRAV